jgi:PRTRC genetic system protein A
MSDANRNDDFDLGSEPNEVFDPFGDDDWLEDEVMSGNEGGLGEEGPKGDIAPNAEEATEEAAREVVIEQPQAKPPPQAPAQAQAASQPKPQVKPQVNPQTPTLKQTEALSGSDGGNPLESAIDAADNKTAETARQSLFEKPPVFEFGGAKEDIADPTQTFDELRIAKAADFPELEDGKRVSWIVEYGKITKHVSDPKGTSIIKMKSDIESSKEFLDALKKAKDKNPDCKVKPKVTAQSKGVVPAPSYKGVFTTLDEAESAGKLISIVPAKDGVVYEIRNTEMGEFITPTSGDSLLSEIRAGFVRALPLIPKKLLLQIIAFFRHFTLHGADSEALLNIYWDKHNSEFIVDAPEQIVSKTSVNSRVSEDYANEKRYIHYMDIHSHNTMRAFFSAIDNADEKATRLYAVVGRLQKFIPNIKVRLSNGGKFLEIKPGEVFEPIGEMFPDEWLDKVSFRASHKDMRTQDAHNNFNESNKKIAWLWDDRHGRDFEAEICD